MKSLILPMLSLLVASPSVSNIAPLSAPITHPVELIVLNSEDYMLLDENGDEVLLREFEEYCKATDGVDVHVRYSNFSTNEELLSKMEGGTSSPDLVCVSDYVIQKLMNKRMAYPFANGEAERRALYGERYDGWEDDNYDLYCSPYLKNAFHNITASVGGEIHSLDEYARGYMWGTLGITYNPALATYAERGLTVEDVHVQMADWNSLWSGKFDQTFQIKDSMRDTYAVGLMHVFDRYLTTLRGWYLKGVDNAGKLYGDEEYNRDTSTIFNNINHIDDFNALVAKIDPNQSAYTVDSIVDQVRYALDELKAASFGMEVDSGKTDIADGKKSGICISWSGDAITSMDIADTSGKADLYYCVPRTGGNIWFDAWALTTEDPVKQEYANKLMDFLSDPSVASRNMDYIGYTSFIAGDDILTLIREWYDPRSWSMYAYDSAIEDGILSSWVVYDYTNDPEGEPVYLDGSGEKEVTITNEDGEEETLTLDMGTLDMTGSDYSQAVVDGQPMSWDDFWPENNPDDNDWMKVDLSYFFEGSLSDYEDEDMIFYTSEMEEVVGHNLSGQEQTVYVGRQFLAQYPCYDLSYKSETDEHFSFYQISSLAVMEDYGDNNDFVVKMWEAVKSGGVLSVTILVILIIELVLVVSLALYFIIRKKITKDLRKKRRAERLA